MLPQGTAEGRSARECADRSEREDTEMGGGLGGVMCRMARRGWRAEVPGCEMHLALRTSVTWPLRNNLKFWDDVALGRRQQCGSNVATSMEWPLMRSLIERIQ